MQVTVNVDVPPGVDPASVRRLVEMLAAEALNTHQFTEKAAALLANERFTNFVESAPLAKLRRFRPEVFALMERMAATQTRKAHGYASEEDPYSNYGAAGAQLGLQGWCYVEARLAEKQARLQQQIAKGNMEGSSAESPEELAVDRANLALISCVMYRRDNPIHRDEPETRETVQAITVTAAAEEKP